MRTSGSRLMRRLRLRLWPPTNPPARSSFALRRKTFFHVALRASMQMPRTRFRTNLLRSTWPRRSCMTNCADSAISPKRRTKREGKQLERAALAFSVFSLRRRRMLRESHAIFNKWAFEEVSRFVIKYKTWLFMSPKRSHLDCNCSGVINCTNSPRLESLVLAAGIPHERASSSITQSLNGF
jgi:hypothetical protein